MDLCRADPRVGGGCRGRPGGADGHPRGQIRPIRAEPTAELSAEQALADMSDAKVVALAASVAFVTAVSILGAAYAVGKIGSAALGAAAEKPELLNRSLALVGLAEGLAVIGFVVAFILLRKF